MSEQLDEMTLTIGDFKNQIGQMVKAISHFNSSDRTEAFGYLQNCVRNLEPASDDGTPFNENGSEDNQFIEGSGDTGGDLLRNRPIELEYSDYELIDKPESVNNFSDDECGTKCCNCGKQFLTSNELYSHGLKDHPGNEMSCQNCLKTFSCLQFYKIHLSLKNVCSLNKHPGGTLLCPYCDKEYQNFQHFSLHVEGHKRNKCEECGVHFNSRKTLEEHTLNKHNKELEKNLFKCKFCSRKYAQKRSLLKHYKLMHHKEIIVCLTCGKIFESVDELKSHEQVHVNNSFTCEMCGEKFVRRQQYVTHLQGHDKYQCLTCEISCTNKVKLEKHEREGHIIKGLSTDHQCSICGSLFHFQSSLFFHKKLHSVSSEEHYGCKPCKRIFKNYSTYKEHLLTEQHESSVDSGEPSNPIPCKYCNKMFSQKRSLEKHVKRYHCKKKQILYKCDICDFKSNLEGAFQKHEKLHTKKKEFICEKCGDSFYTKNALLDHIKFVHSEERNFSCEKCGQTFKSVSVLNRHMLCHNKERTFKCHCGQSYKFSGNLNRHQLLAHGKATKSKRVKRLIVDEIADLTSKSSENKKKRELKEKEKSNNTSKIYTIIDSQAAVSLPLEQIIAEGNFLLSGTQSDSQILHAACHNLNFSSESRAPLVLSQNIDISTFREVDTLLQSDDSLKTTNTSGTVDSTVQNIFVRHLTEADSNGFLDSESLIHLPIETSLVTSLDDSSLNSVDQLGTSGDQSHGQTHLQALPEVPYYNIHFLDI